jgi:hypothetical protein
MDPDYMREFKAAARAAERKQSQVASAKEKLRKIKDERDTFSVDPSARRRRRFPMDDLQLVREDEYYKDPTGKGLPRRPAPRGDPLGFPELRL